MAKIGILVRHAKHGEAAKNVLNVDQYSILRDLGVALKDQGYEIKRVVSSPQWRALSTAIEILKGYGTMVPLSECENRLGDMSNETDVDVDALKQAAADANVGVEPYLLQYKPLKDLVQRRGIEGAQALREAAAATTDGKAFLAVSHGGARIETTVMELEGLKAVDDEPPFLAEECSVTLLYFEEDSTYIRHEHIGIPVE